MPRKIRILHCPNIVGGHAQNLARFERKLGLDSWAVALKTNYADYECDEVLCKEKYGILKQEFKRWLLLFRALFCYDIIHLNFGSTILTLRLDDRPIFKLDFKFFSLRSLYFKIFEYKDLWLMKIFKKAIIVTYQGDDARQKDFCVENFEITHAKEVGSEYYPPGSDEKKRKTISKFNFYADIIYALNPDLLHVLPHKTKFLPYGHIDIEEWKYIGVNRDHLQTPVVLHAPSHEDAKGTKYIIDAVERLKKENITFTFILVEGMSIAEAKRQYEKADLLVDQLLAGWYGGLAVELMALGKPVICYIREEDLKFITDEMRNDLPIINATPNSIYSVLKEWLTNKKRFLNETGKKSRSYVEKWHDPIIIAQRLKNDYEAVLESKKR